MKMPIRKSIKRIPIGKVSYCPPAARVRTQSKFKVTEKRIAALKMSERIESGIKYLSAFMVRFSNR
jgi:hypothetical protein